MAENLRYQRKCYHFDVLAAREKTYKKHVFSFWRDATEPNRQAKLGLASGWGQEAPFGFDGVYGDVE